MKISNEEMVREVNELKEMINSAHTEAEMHIEDMDSLQDAEAFTTQRLKEILEKVEAIETKSF